MTDLTMYLVVATDNMSGNQDYFVAATTPEEAYAIWTVMLVDEYEYELPTDEVRVFVVPSLPDTPGVCKWNHTAEHCTTFKSDAAKHSLAIQAVRVAYGRPPIPGGHDSVCENCGEPAHSDEMRRWATDDRSVCVDCDNNASDDEG